MVNKKKILTFISAVVLSASLLGQGQGLGLNIKDVEGNTYKTVQIGTQVWMAENLKTSKYNDGSTITKITDDTQWGNNTTGAWCYYNNDAANNTKYGKLYNWYAVSKKTNGNKNICPTGWHVPSGDEWDVLIWYLGGPNDAGGKMKEVGMTNWTSPNSEATNSSLFTGLPGGCRYDEGGYGSEGSEGSWWNSNDYNIYLAYFCGLKHSDGFAARVFSFKKQGMSLRCLRD